MYWWWMSISEIHKVDIYHYKIRNVQTDRHGSQINGAMESKHYLVSMLCPPWIQFHSKFNFMTVSGGGKVQAVNKVKH